jgi:hypothetical protein
MKRSRRLISLVRYLVCHSVLTQRLFTLECGIAHMVASLSMAVAGTIHTLTPLFELTADMCVGMVFFFLDAIEEHNKIIQCRIRFRCICIAVVEF